MNKSLENSELEFKLTTLVEKEFKDLPNVSADDIIDSKILASHKKHFVESILKMLEKNPQFLLSLNKNIRRNLHKDVKKKIDQKFSALINAQQELSRRHLIYEAYKILNPKRIAGETEIENYKHNYLIGGIKKAEKYSKGKIGKKIPAKDLKTIQAKRSSLVKGNSL
ncbi:MAG: DUF5394 family protein [Rickettsia sp.]|nr:DUF5394 family protein [Rickettsia sp.]